MSSETYSVAALAAAVGVPRTTINDWLVRYENFIEFSAAGKRKVYSEQSLLVLKEIARLRDAGKSGAEIEQLLAQSHGVKPEVAAASSDSDANAPLTAESSAGNTENDQPPQLPSIKKFEQSAMELTAFIAELQQQQQRSVRKSRWVSWLLIVIIVILLAVASVAGWVLYNNLVMQQQKTAAMQSAMTELNAVFAAELKALEKLRQEELAAAGKTAAALQKELLQQRQLRLQEVQELSARLTADRQAWQEQLVRQEKIMADKSAAERQQLLEKMAAESARSQAQMAALKQELSAANGALQQLNNQLIKLEKERKTVLPSPAAPAAPATEGAAPAAEEAPAAGVTVPEKNL